MAIAIAAVLTLRRAQLLRQRHLMRLRHRLRELKQTHGAPAAAREHSKDRFIATMSHEIRTPLHGLMATLDMLRVETLSAEGAHRLAIARSSAKTLLNIANDILDLSRIDEGAIPLERKVFSLQAVLNEAVDEARARAEVLKLRLSAQIAGRLPQAVVGDPARIKQILRNLLSNALKFTPAGTVTLQARYDGGKCVIDVQDTGEGVPENKRALIFEPFIQAESASTRRFGGAGLGLPISRRLSEAMGGSLTLLRTGPGGSTFRVTLPLEVSDDPPLEEQSQRILRTIPGRVLVVEDDPASQYVAQTLLESLLCPVTVATSGADALELLAQEEFDLAFMDCEMPGLDGYETTRRARALLAAAVPPRTIPIIGMTASTMSADRQRCFEAGMDDVLPKPFAKPALNEMLLKWLAPGTIAPVAAGADERLRDLPVIDGSVFDELWASLQWRMPAMRKIYESFLSATDETLTMLERSAPSPANRDAGRRIHSLVGSAGLVGARQVEYLAGWLSDAVKEARHDDMDRTLSQLRDGMRRFQDELDRRLDALASGR
jgi:CheY-like chemotaxis protein